MKKRIITTENLDEDIKIENHLRPQLLKDYIAGAPVQFPDCRIHMPVSGTFPRLP